MAYMYEQEDGTLALCSLQSSIPQSRPFSVLNELPQDKEFRSAWKFGVAGKVEYNIDKAKDILHEKRRTKRDEAFKPNLNIIDKHVKGIPLKADEDVDVARADNAKIKDADDKLQQKIDKAKNIDALKKIIDKEGLK